LTFFLLDILFLEAVSGFLGCLIAKSVIRCIG